MFRLLRAVGLLCALLGLFLFGGWLTSTFSGTGTLTPLQREYALAVACGLLAIGWILPN